VRRGAVAVLAAAAALAVPAAAAAEIELRQPNVARYPEVEVAAVTSTASQRPPVLRENGRRVVGLRADNLAAEKSIVLAIDRSRSMQGQAFRDAVAAARQFLGNTSSADRVGIVSFGSRSLTEAPLSNTRIDVEAALRELSIDTREGTALYDAVAASAELLASEDREARVLVLLTDGADVSSATSLGAAVAAAKKSGVAVYAIGIEGEQFSVRPLQQVARETGGAYRAASSSGALTSAYASVAEELRRTWRLSYVTAARPGEHVTLGTFLPGGNDSDTLGVSMPGRSEGPATAPASGLLPSWAYTSETGSLFVGLAVGVLLLVALAFVAAARRGSWLRSRLSAHLGEVRPGGSRTGGKGDRFAAGSAVMSATERTFGHLQVWRKVARMLERADVPMRTVEFIYVAVGSSFGLGLFVAVLGRSTLEILAAFAVGGAAPFAYLTFKGGRRLKAFENQLPDLLLTIAASLKAGHSFKQGLQTVVDEGQPPASKELSRALAEARLGRPVEEALAEMSQRVGSKDLEFVITAVTIQSQVGGSLAGLFDMVAEAVRQRQQFARKIRGLTAMGRASAYVLVGLPFVTAALITLINPSFMDPLYHTGTGHMLIVLGLTMMAVGSLILKKIVSFRG
jgi:tight adherence protein B